MSDESKAVAKGSLGIIGTLIGMGFACGVYLTVLRSNVTSLDSTMQSGFVALDKQLTKIETQLRDGSAAMALVNRAVAILEARLDAIEKRVVAIEAKAGR